MIRLGGLAGGLAVMLLCASAPCGAEASLDISLRPKARAVAYPVADPVANPVAVPDLGPTRDLQKTSLPRPVARVVTRHQTVFAPNVEALLLQALRSHSFPQASLRPYMRNQAKIHLAMARQRGPRVAGIAGVQGEAIGSVEGPGACGIDRALRVTAVSGVQLSSPALLDAPTTKALKTWVDKGLLPAIGNMGGGVETMRVVAHYACRTRNSQAGARLSEHSFGRAIDIAGFTLRNGERIVLLEHWGRGRKGRALRRMHASACGPFGTVLGPEANRFHRDHFHFDTARYRSGSYCR